jgi:hypothetical protein
MELNFQSLWGHHGDAMKKKIPNHYVFMLKPERAACQYTFIGDSVDPVGRAIKIRLESNPPQVKELIDQEEAAGYRVHVQILSEHQDMFSAQLAAAEEMKAARAKGFILLNKTNGHQKLKRMAQLLRIQEPLKPNGLYTF